MSEQQYRLTMNKGQAYALVNALDLLSRVGMGQLEVVAEHVSFRAFSAENQTAMLHGLQDDLRLLKEKIGHRRNGSFGICNENTTQQAKVAWDIACVVRREIARVERHGEHSGWHQAPLHTGKESLAICEARSDA